MAPSVARDFRADGGDPVTIGVVGSGPAAEAIEAAMDDTDAVSRRIEVAQAASPSVTVVVDEVGAGVFERANTHLEGVWLSLELGGIGGARHAHVEAAISVLDGDGGCFECLRTRVEANRAEDDGFDKGEGPARSDERLAGAMAGRLVVSLLSGDPIQGRVWEVPSVERHLLPVPACSCGQPPARSIRREEVDLSLETAIERAEPGIDERIGVLHSIGEVHSFPAPYYLASMADTTELSDVAATKQAAGVAVDWNEAFMKAVGEGLERYAAGVYRRSWFETAPAAALEDTIEPARFVRPDEGFPPPDSEEPLEWIRGKHLRTGRQVWLPAEFVVFPPVEQRHRPSITTGLGLGSSSVGAMLSGLSETIERDATMLSWYSTFEPLELEVDDEAFITLRRRARAEDLEATALLVTQDVDVPVVTVCVHREESWPKFAVGSGAALDPQVAARAGLAEALQNWLELRSMGVEAAAEEGAIGDYADFPREARAFVDPGGHIQAADLAPNNPPTGGAALDVLVDRVEEAGLDAYAARLTPRDVEELGFEAVRVLVPSAQPLLTDVRYFGERARQVPRELGFRPRFDRPHHPYP